jgi:hypothetical protein
MKKKLLMFILSLMTVSLVAQEESATTFKPSKNNFSVEVNFTPFNGATLISVNGFRGRLFLNEKMALRLGATFDMQHNEAEFPVQLNGATYYSKDDQQYTTLGIMPGFEYHFLTTPRFSPYAGISAGYENKTSKGSYEDPYYNGGSTSSIYIMKTEAKNSWLAGSSSTYYYDQRGYSMLSVNLLMGADIYILKHLYMGFEFGFGYDALFHKKIEITVDGVSKPEVPKSMSGGFGFNADNAIRLGYWF